MDPRLSHRLQGVVSFWFGNFLPDVLRIRRKTLWFVKDQVKRENVDKRISSLFKDLLSEIESRNDDIIFKNCLVKDPKGLLGAIITLDQFTRHIYRDDQKVIAENTLAAVNLVQFSMKMGVHASFNAAETVFFLMPIRHHYNITKYNENDLILYKSMQNLLACATEKEQQLKAHRALLQDFCSVSQRSFVACDNGMHFTPDDILDRNCVPFETMQRFGLKENYSFNGIYSTILSYIIQNIPNLDLLRMKQLEKPHFLKINLFVSLSGGVDSMVILHVLSRIRENMSLCFSSSMQDLKTSSKKNENTKETSMFSRNVLHKAKKENKKASDIIEDIISHKKENYANYIKTMKSKFAMLEIETNVVAIHINYNNRSESKAEADFLARYCASIGAKFYLTDIRNMTRSNSDRESYERETRKARFEAYEEAFKKHESTLPSVISTGVFLGHHQGDVEENVVSNIAKATGLLQLSGMTQVSKLGDVHLLRPLLRIEKKRIYEYASIFDVPYFKDTTPIWSTRYKLRNNVIPALSHCYGSGFHNSLYSVATESDELREFLNDKLYFSYFRTVKYGKLATIVPLTFEGKRLPNFALRHILKEVFNTLGYKQANKNAITMLIEMLSKTFRSDFVGVELKDDNRCFIYKKKYLIIMEQSFYSSPNSDKKYRVLRDKKEYVNGSGTVYFSEQWSVDIVEKETNGLKNEDLLLKFLITGELRYNITIFKDSKFKYPVELKNVPSIVRDFLPLLNVYTNKPNNQLFQISLKYGKS